MYVLNAINDYDFSNNCAINENEDIITVVKILLLSIPSSILLLSLISLIIWTILKLLSTNI